MGFTINIAKGIKKPPTPKQPKKVSRMCIGECIKEDDIYKIKIDTKCDYNYPDFIIIGFTDKSFDTTGRSCLFEKKRDSKGRRVKHLFSSDDNKRVHSSLIYETLNEGEICSGYIVRDNGILLFDLKDVHGRGNYVNNLPSRLEDNKPLFGKDEHNGS